MPPGSIGLTTRRTGTRGVRGPSQLLNPDWPVVLICPVSSGEQGSPYDVKYWGRASLAQEEGVVFGLRLAQPLDKKEPGRSASR